MGIPALFSSRSHYMGEGASNMPTGPRPETPNVAEVTMEFKQDGQFLYNKHHFFDDAGFDEGRLNNLGAAIYTWWNDNMKSSTNYTCSLTAITCRDLSASNGLQTAVTTGLPLAGTAQLQPLPNSCTLAIKKATGLSGRSYHGRTYHVGLSVEWVVGNTVLAARVTELRDKYTLLITPGGGLFDPELVVLSEVTAGEWRPTGIATKVTGIAVDNTIDNQRRRLPGRGR